jgi:hypothetical protein
MNYDVKQATAADLKHLLNSAPTGATVVAIVPYGTAGTDYLIIFKLS